MKLKYYNILIPMTILNLLNITNPIIANAIENQVDNDIEISEINQSELQTSILIENPENYKVTLPNGNVVSKEKIVYTVNKNGLYDFVVDDNSGQTTVQSININNLRKNLLVTNKRDVVLKLTASDSLSGMGQMKFKNENNGTWSNYESYATTKKWTLDSKEGLKSVYVMYKDIAGNETTEIFDQIYLDISGPTINTFTINNGSKYTKKQDVVLNVSATDNYSNVDYFLVSNDNINWTKVENKPNIPWTLSGGAGNKTVYLKGVDSLGNIGTVSTQTIYFDNILPTGSISINNGASITNSRNVTLQLNFGDLHAGVKRVSVIEGEKIYTFPKVPSSPTELDWTLSLGLTGQVALEVEDNAGNIYRTYSNEITIASLEVTQFRLTNVVNPFEFTSTNPFKPLIWDFPAQKMVAGGNISFDINYRLDLDSTTTAIVSGDYVIELIGDNYHKVITQKYDSNITNGFEATITIPEDAPKGTKVYLYSSLEAILTNNKETFTDTTRFPGESEKALIGIIENNIKEGIQFNEIR